MSCRITRKKQAPTFEPFVLEIEVSSEEELMELWHRFQLSVGVLRTNASPEVIYPSLIPYSDAIWQTLNEEIDLLDMKQDLPDEPS